MSRKLDALRGAKTASSDEGVFRYVVLPSGETKRVISKKVLNDALTEASKKIREAERKRRRDSKKSVRGEAVA